MNLFKDKKAFVLCCVALAIIVLSVVGARGNKRNFSKGVNASTGSQLLTSQADWQSGTYDVTSLNLTAIPGSMKLGDESIITLNNSNITANSSIATKDTVNDGDVDTYWESWIYGVGDEAWIRVNLGATYNVTKIRIHAIAGAGSVDLQSSLDDSTYTSFDTAVPGASWQEIAYSPAKELQYVRFYVFNATGSPMEATVSEVEFYQSPTTATHTTAPTQIDGGDNFWQWESFTDSKTTPTNTSVTYRYRSSADGTTWNSWHNSIASVESRSGDDSGTPTKYRYLQVEATLSNTDGVSTPTIDSYSIGYHTNQPPNQPTAMTAVVN